MAWLVLAGLVFHIHGASPDAVTGPVVEPVSRLKNGQVNPAPAPYRDHDPDAVTTLDDVVVNARRGAAKVPPVVELDGAQIDALGAWSIGEVLKSLDDLYGGQDETLVLINGQRVPMASVFSGFPPDAAVRIEVLPPEAAGLYGGRPGQTVYNLVLQPRYASVDLGLGLSGPVQGGTIALRADAQRSAIDGQNTHQLRMGVRRETELRTGEREILDANGVPEDPDGTLRPASQGVDVTAMMTRSIMGWGTVFNLSGRSSESRSTARIGQLLVESRQRSNGVNLALGASGQVLGWTLNSNTSYAWNDSQNRGFSPSDSLNQSLGLNLSGNRQIIELPAGAIMANLNASLFRNWMETQREGTFDSQEFDVRNLRASVNLPILKAGEQGLGRLGAIQADIGLGQNDSGDNRGEDVSFGLAWQPAQRVRLNGTFSQSQSSVGDIMRLQPITYGTPRTVFDFRRGEAVEVLTLMGGNPDLVAPINTGIHASLSVGPLTPWQVSANLNYNHSQSEDGIGSLPDITEEVEATFPDRFTRDGTGRLVEVDFRPLNLSSSLNESLGISVNLPLPMARYWPETAGAVPVVQARLGYTLQLRSQTRLIRGLPERDQLRGDGGGRPRQDLRASMDVRRGGLGLGLNLRWQDEYRNRRYAGVDGPDDLVRSSLMITDLRLSWQIMAAPRAPVEGAPPARRSGGLELALEVNNLTDARPEARLGDGSAAPGYGRDRQDPIGRSLSLNLRRRF